MLDSSIIGEALYGQSNAPATPTPPPSNDAPLADKLYPSSNPQPANTTLLRNAYEQEKSQPIKAPLKSIDPATLYGEETYKPEPTKERTEDYFEREQRLREGLYGKGEDESSNTEPPASEAKGIDEAIESAIPASIAEIRNSEDRANLENDFTIEIPDEEYEKVFEDPLVGKAVAQEIRAIANDLALTYSDLDTIGDAIGRIQETPWTNESRMESRERAVQLLNEEFGYGAAQAFKDAQKLASRDPRVLRMLEETGAGDDAGVVLALARAAKTQKNRANYQRTRR